MLSPVMLFINMNYTGLGLHACSEFLKVLLVSPIVPSDIQDIWYNSLYSSASFGIIFVINLVHLSVAANSFLVPGFTDSTWNI